jgi:hypothetical protein
MPAAELVPQRLELDRGVDEPVVPEQRDHLPVGQDRTPGRRGRPDQAADQPVESRPVQGGAARHQLAQGLAGVQRQVPAVLAGGGEIGACLRQPGLELTPVLRGRDDDRHAPAAERPQQVVGHPFRQFPVVTVELNNVLTAVQVFRPNHYFSIW